MTEPSWRLGRSAFEAIEAHGRASYPEECCGFLLAPASAAEGDRRYLRHAVPTPNRAPAERTRRYVIDPLDLLRAERSAAPSDRLVGIYHSHPDHPAVPSEFDRERAWPWYSYLVLSVPREGPPVLGAFEWDPSTRQFHPRRLRIDDGRPSDDPEDRGDGPVNR